MIRVLAIIVGCGVLLLALFVGNIFFTIHNEGQEKSEKIKWFESLNPVMRMIVAAFVGGLILLLIFSIINLLCGKTISK
jgi:hypothetical protein